MKSEMMSMCFGKMALQSGLGRSSPDVGNSGENMLQVSR